MEGRRARLDGALQALAQQHELDRALADIELVEWLIRHGAELSASERLVWITGWTTSDGAAALCAPLHASGLRSVVQMPEPDSYTHLRAHETAIDIVCRLLLDNTN